MSIYILKNSDNKMCNDVLISEIGELNRLGIAVSKKYSKSSVRRNRVKRLIREVYRLNEDNIKTGNSIIILWKNNVEIENVNYTSVSNDLLKCLKKACIYKKEECNA